MRKIVAEIKRVFRFANTSVLIQGESGTGKELVSRAIHHGSSRTGAPFIPVNCVAIPAELAGGKSEPHLPPISQPGLGRKVEVTKVSQLLHREQLQHLNLWRSPLAGSEIV